MTRPVNIVNINEAAAQRGLRLEKALGFFYWVPASNDRTVLSLPKTSIYVTKITDLSWSRWMLELSDIANQINDRKAVQGVN